MQNVFVDTDNKVTLSCPICGKSKTIDVAKYLSSDGPVKLTYRFRCDSCDCGHKDCRECLQEECSLGHTNTVKLERRKHARKETRLQGTVQIGRNRPRPVQVLDLSRHGARIEISTPQRISAGDQGLLEFRLDDQKMTPVSKRGNILRIQGKNAVFLFRDADTLSIADKAIGFYLVR